MKHLFPFLLFLLLFSACKKGDNPTTAGFDSKNLIRRWTFKTIDADYDGKTYSVAATLLETPEAEYKADGSYAQYADKKASDTCTWKLTSSIRRLDRKLSVEVELIRKKPDYVRTGIGIGDGRVRQTRPDQWHRSGSNGYL